jgi:hypothetical protein
MSERENEVLKFPAPDSLARIHLFFDKLECLVERSERLLLKVKYLIFGLAFLLFLIYEMAHFGHYLLSNWY